MALAIASVHFVSPFGDAPKLSMLTKPACGAVVCAVAPDTNVKPATATSIVKHLNELDCVFIFMKAIELFSFRKTFPVLGADDIRRGGVCEARKVARYGTSRTR